MLDTTVRLRLAFSALLLAAAAAAPLAAQSPAERAVALLPRLGSAEAAEVERADQELERLCFEAGRPGAEAERRALALELARALDGDLASPAKVRILGRLETLGKAEVVPQLAKLLLAEAADPAVRDAARRALEANPNPRAKTELRAAVARTSGALRAAVCRSLGARRDILAVGVLMEAARDVDRDVRLAALDALARVGDEQCVAPLEEALNAAGEDELVQVRRSFLRLAGALAENGERGMARRLYVRALEMGPEQRAEALVGMAKAGLQSEIPKIVGALTREGEAAEVRSAAMEAAVVFAGQPMTGALLEALGAPESAPAVKLVLLEVLARRGDPAATVALGGVFVKDEDDSVRRAALEAIGACAAAGSAEAIDVLLLALAAGGETAERAETLLGNVKDASLAQRLGEALLEAAGEPRLRLVRLLGAQPRSEAVEYLKRAKALEDPALRVAVIRALARIGGAEAFTLLRAAAAETGNSHDARECERALRAIHAENKRDLLLEAYRESARPVWRWVFLGGLVGDRDAEALAVFRTAVAATESNTAEIRAALEGLAAAEDVSSLDLVVRSAERFAEGSDQELASSSLRAALSLATVIGREDAARASFVYARCLELAHGDDERRVALAGLAEVGEADALERLLPFLASGPLERDAGRAALRLASRLPESRREEAVAIYRRILDLDLDDATLRQCVDRLRKLGVAVDPARERGCVTRWWIAGPLANAGRALYEKVLALESAAGGGIDLASPVVDGKTAVPWRPHHESDPRGVVDLLAVVAARDEVGAYLYAEVTVAEAADVLLKIGSDDQVVCWLNGEKVHASPHARGITPDEDTVKTRLHAGANRVLLKVLNESGGWAASLRITDILGKPIVFTQRGE
jgi:HEAT repeat protein